MIERILLLSGAKASGKTCLAKALQEQLGFLGISSSNYLKEVCAKEGMLAETEQLQNLGDRLDAETDFYWVVENAAIPSFKANPTAKHWYLDAVRKRRQIDHFKARYGSVIKHIHLWAPEYVLLARYTNRPGCNVEDYAKAVQHPNEVSARSLLDTAEKAFDTSVSSVSDIVDWVKQAWEH